MADALAGVKPGESTLKVSLHPLVLLTASDLLTRHQLRGLDGPAVGLILGQQLGNEITAEHAFTAKLEDGLLDHRSDWTAKRIEQYKEVHKSPALEVVGWFALCPETGPIPEHSIFHKQIRSLYAENAIFVAIHGASLNFVEGTKGKLPVSVFESADNDFQPTEGKMQVDGADDLSFQPVPYTIETDETEMIAINYVAKGAGSAAAVDGSASTGGAGTKDNKRASKAGLASTHDEENTKVSPQSRVLTADEEDELAGITTRLNSVKMLQSRLQLLSRLIASVPPSYLNDQSISIASSSIDTLHLQHLRSIQALLTRLSLLTPGSPTGSASLSEASQAQSNDVAMTSLLATLGQETQSLSDLGKKSLAIDMIRSVRTKSKSGYSANAFGGMDEHDGQMGGFAMNSSLMM